MCIHEEGRERCAFMKKVGRGVHAGIHEEGVHAGILVYMKKVCMLVYMKKVGRGVHAGIHEEGRERCACWYT